MVNIKISNPSILIKIKSITVVFLGLSLFNVDNFYTILLTIGMILIFFINIVCSCFLHKHFYIFKKTTDKNNKVLNEYANRFIRVIKYWLISEYALDISLLLYFLLMKVLVGYSYNFFDILILLIIAFNSKKNANNYLNFISIREDLIKTISK